jgi:transposase, IS30 family
MKIGHLQTEIAEIVRVHKSTISKELRCNRGWRGYRPKQAQRFSKDRQNKAQAWIEPQDWQQFESLISLK